MFQKQVHLLGLCLLLAPSALWADPTPAELLDQAEQLRAQSQWEPALAILRDVVSGDSEDAATAAQAQVMIGQYRLFMAMPEDAEEELAKVAELFGDQPDAVNAARLHMIDALSFQGKDEEAIAVALALGEDEAVRACQRAWGYVKLADLRLRAGQTEPALAALQALELVEGTCTGISPWEQGLFQQANILLAQNSSADALPILDHLLTLADQQTPLQRNALRVKLLHALVEQKQWVRVPDVVNAILNEDVAAEANKEMAAWAYAFMGRMYEELANQAADQDDLVNCLDSRRLAGDAYRLASQAGGLTEPGLAGTNRLVDLITADHHFDDEEHDAVPAWMMEARRHLALALAGQHVLNGEPSNCSPVNPHCVRQIFRLAAADDHSHEYARALAWYRLALSVPARSPADEEDAGDGIVRMLEKSRRHAEVIQWRTFLADPNSVWDPTSGTIATELGVDLERAFVPADASRSALFSALADAQAKAGQPDEALTTYGQALQLAQSPRDRGMAESGITEVLADQATQARVEMQFSVARQKREEAATYARQAAVEWQSIVVSGEGDRHYAIKLASETLRIADLRPEALTLATELVEGLRQAEAPARDVFFAEFFRIRALAMNRRYAEAATAAELASEQMAASDDPIIDIIRAHVLIRACSYHISAGNVPAATEAFQLADQVYSGRYDAWLDVYRHNLTKRGALQ